MFGSDFLLVECFFAVIQFGLRFLPVLVGSGLAGRTVFGVWSFYIPSYSLTYQQFQHRVTHLMSDVDRLELVDKKFFFVWLEHYVFFTLLLESFGRQNFVVLPCVELRRFRLDFLVSSWLYSIQLGEKLPQLVETLCSAIDLFSCGLGGLSVSLSGRFTRAQRSQYVRVQKGSVPISSVDRIVLQFVATTPMKYGVTTLCLRVAAILQGIGFLLRATFI